MKMNGNLFDRLAREVARGMSRREAVKLLAGTTAMAVFGSWVRPDLAMSARPGTAQKGCGGVTTPGTENCGGIRTFYRADCQKPVAKKNYTPDCNGCGPEGGVFGTGINAVPNSPFYLANFEPACNGHDVGYSTCNRPKDVTDEKFLADMNTICSNTYPSTGMFDTITLLQCMYSAATFYKAVKEGGEDAYKSGQAGACDCCDECPGGAPKCSGQCCRGPDWVCGSSGLCCQDCQPGWKKCAYPNQVRCGFGCCMPDLSVCCPGIRPGDLRCCSPKGKCFKGGCG